MTYSELDDVAQVEALRPLAADAARSFGLTVQRMEVIRHAYNTTFAVDTASGSRVALRVNTNSISPAGEVRAQQEWQRAITAETDVLVPSPLRTQDGDWVHTAATSPLARPVLVTAASWLDGPDVVTPDAATARAMGRTMALLHRQAAGWEHPCIADLPALLDPLRGEPWRLGDAAAGLGADAADVVTEALARGRDTGRRALAGAPLIPVHADLHGGNLKWQGTRLAVFDFDDCGRATPALDLAIALFYLRRTTGADEVESALVAGYRGEAPLPDIAAADLETLVAARQVLLANSLLASTTAELHEMAQRYLPVAVDRLSTWLDTGRFPSATTEGPAY